MKFLNLNNFLELLINNKINQDAIRTAGGIEALVAALNRGDLSPIAHKHILGALRGLVVDNADNIKALTDAGGIKALVMALSKPHVTEKQIEHATYTLLKLASNNTENKDAIRLEGGIEVLVNALRGANPTSELAGELARAINAIGDKNPENVKAITNAGGMEIFVALLNYPESTPMLAKQITSALFSLALSRQNQNIIRKAGGISALVSVLNKANSTEEALTNASGALWNLSIHNQENLEEIMKKGGIRALLSLLKRVGAEPELLEYATGALCILTTDYPSSQSEVLKEGGITPLISLLDNKVFTFKTRRLAAIALGEIANNNLHIVFAINKKGGIPVFVEWLRNTDRLSKEALTLVSEVLFKALIASEETEKQMKMLGAFYHFQDDTVLLDELNSKLEITEASTCIYSSAMKEIATYISNDQEGITSTFPIKATHTIINYLCDNKRSDGLLFCLIAVVADYDDISLFEEIMTSVKGRVKSSTTPFAEAGAGSGFGGPTGRDKNDPPADKELDK